LVALLKSIPGHPDNTQTLEVWTKLFNIAEANPHKRAASVSEHLNAMYREVELVRQRMETANYSEELYSRAIANVENALSTMLLSGTWNLARQYLTAETFVALSFCAEILPDEEEPITADVLANIAAQVQELENSLTGPEIPPRLRRLIEHHIALIRRALAEYPITGANAFREAARTGLGEIVEISDTLESSGETPQVIQLGALWKAFNDAADVALKGEKIVQLAHKTWGLLGGLF
jgi:hypothetical protein